MSEWGLFLDRGSTPRSSTKSRTAERLRPVFLLFCKRNKDWVRKLIQLCFGWFQTRKGLTA